MKNHLTRRFSTLLLALAGASGLLMPVAAMAQEGQDQVKKEDSKKKDPDLAASVNPDDPAAVSVYVIDVRGDFGKDFSANLMKELLADAKKRQPDIILFRVDAAFLNQRGDGPGDIRDMRDTFTVRMGLQAAEGIGVQLIDDIDADPEWKKKPRRVAWVKKALGPTALLPFFCKEIYFAPDGMHGGIGYLDFFFANMVDQVVREKLRGATLGHIEGLAVKGGHDYRIVRAMTRMDYELSYTLKGGKPDFRENRTEGEVLLTDDGDAEAGRADTVEDFVQLKGNDVLNLRADTALTLGWSAGTAESLGDLMYELGHSRAYRVIAEPARKIASEFATRVGRNRDQVMKLERDVRANWERRGEGDTVDVRNSNRAKLKRMLEEMNAILRRYPEAVHRIADPEQQMSQNNQRIAVLEQEIRMDRTAPRRPGGR
ncbi:MAG TPA: hypothetical protein VEB22_12175 [Phycisphaerales bacterium]|nr:hypothetical protein [Phycisphaerales bacterium]